MPMASVLLSSATVGCRGTFGFPPSRRKNHLTDLHTEFLLMRLQHVVIASSLVALAIAGCKKSSSTSTPAAPSALLQNGTYTMTAWSCGSTDLLAALSSGGYAAPQIVVGASGSSLQYLSASDSCVESDALTFASPNSTTLNATQGATTCSSSCSSSAISCTPAAAPSPALVDSYTEKTANGVITLTGKVLPAEASNTNSTYGDNSCAAGSVGPCVGR